MRFRHSRRTVPISRSTTGWERGTYGTVSISRMLRIRKDRTQTGDHAIRGTETGRPFLRTLEDQQLVLDEHGFGHHERASPGPASRATVASRCRNGTARSRTAGSYQDCDTGKACSRILESAMHTDEGFKLLHRAPLFPPGAPQNHIFAPTAHATASPQMDMVVSLVTSNLASFREPTTSIGRQSTKCGKWRWSHWYTSVIVLMGIV
jgi:hypothetical protein